MKVKILVFTFNRPELLEKQVKCLHKNLKCEYEILVVHDSRQNEYVNQFSEICSKLNLEFHHHPQIEGTTNRILKIKEFLVQKFENRVIFQDAFL